MLSKKSQKMYQMASSQNQVIHWTYLEALFAIVALDSLQVQSSWKIAPLFFPCIAIVLLCYSTFSCYIPTITSENNYWHVPFSAIATFSAMVFLVDFLHSSLEQMLMIFIFYIYVF